MCLRPAPKSLLAACLLVFLSLGLGACISNDREPELVRTTPVDFHQSFGQMTFKVLPTGQRVRLAINDQDPRFGFNKGVSYYEAIALPDLPQPYVLTIESEVVKTRFYRNGKIFYPVLTFLDANRSWLRTYERLPYVTQKAPVGNHITVSLQVSDELSEARYMVVHTQPDLFDKAIGRDDGQVLLKSRDFNTMMMAPITEPRYRYEFAPVGWVRIQANEKTEESVGQVQPSTRYY